SNLDISHDSRHIEWSKSTTSSLQIGRHFGSGLFLGDSFSAEGDNDDAAGRFLDPVYQTESMGLSPVVPYLLVMSLHWIDLAFHFQITRCRLNGESAREETREDPFRPKHGCRKGHRPDLKPIVLTT
ncbi:MAG: hypothetical protein QGH37_34410, partial [Candidatus Poribacteria bacterium]|nr:hypothetical protein [Candidatus Poribacteria bacterium]